MSFISTLSYLYNVSVWVSFLLLPSSCFHLLYPYQFHSSPIPSVAHWCLYRGIGVREGGSERAVRQVVRQDTSCSLAPTLQLSPVIIRHLYKVCVYLQFALWAQWICACWTQSQSRSFWVRMHSTNVNHGKVYVYSLSEEGICSVSYTGDTRNLQNYYPPPITTWCITLIA